MTKLNKTVFGVEEYNKHIPLFLSNHPMGNVHSVFNNGLNIQMGDNLFFIGTDKNGQLPFGMHLETADVHQLVSIITANDRVEWHPAKQELIFPAYGITITLTKGRSFMNKLERQEDSTQAVIEHLDAFLTVLLNNDEPTGLGLDIEQFMLNYVGELDMNGDLVYRVHDLMAAIFSTDHKQIEQTLRYFLGRGRGLTPSGDDHVVGLLAIHAVTGALSSTFVDVVAKLVENETITTDVGTEYLIYALKGEFSSAVVNIGQDLALEHPEHLEDHIKNLLPMGHSSGVDTAFGMLIGMLALRRTFNGR
ncbi:DUF2877 domain-containing protein [Lentibacillus saliphilus]|uniref:DUF2877 domain-containing protein n=1 Tax=Lentibacillus saliphilus TaxID=2737028 RepID=UPI001C2F9015|nr:DUF2877 domain-containing protein [Lentibacillus saliphilus]